MCIHLYPQKQDIRDKDCNNSYLLFNATEHVDNNPNVPVRRGIGCAENPLQF